MLFGDPHVVEPVRKTFGKWAEPGAASHGCGDGDDPRIGLRLLDESVPEDIGVRPFAADGLRRQDIEGAHPVQMVRSEEHTSELQSRFDLVCRLLLEKKKKKQRIQHKL